jgi:hypothetical protein
VVALSGWRLSFRERRPIANTRVTDFSPSIGLRPTDSYDLDDRLKIGERRPPSAGANSLARKPPVADGVTANDERLAADSCDKHLEAI